MSGTGNIAINQMVSGYNGTWVLQCRFTFTYAFIQLTSIIIDYVLGSVVGSRVATGNRSERPCYPQNSHPTADRIPNKSICQAVNDSSQEIKWMVGWMALVQKL